MFSIWVSWDLTKVVGWGEQRGSFSEFIILAGVGVQTEKGGGNLILAGVRGFDMIPCEAC